MIKFPYGDANFYKIITQNKFFIDRTDKIRLLEDLGDQMLFLRPRRFGKSLWLSILENYYDVRKADEFERLFGHLAIGQNPTPSHNQYMILRWNFSTIETHPDFDMFRQLIHDHLNGRIAAFKSDYRDYLDDEIILYQDNSLHSLQSLFAAIRRTPYKLYLLIDEYDNFANEILMGGHPDSERRYKQLIAGEGMLKTIFKAIKDGLEGQGLDRLFITGVSPLVLRNGY